jgi:hypothetical protein
MNERDVFTAALHRPPEERSAFLDEACHGEVRLRQQFFCLPRPPGAITLLSIPLVPLAGHAGAWRGAPAGGRRGRGPRRPSRSLRRGPDFFPGGEAPHAVRLPGTGDGPGCAAVVPYFPR